MISFLKQKHWHNLSWIPVFIIGLGAVGLGMGWFLHPEPWMLDQQPNEKLLKATFTELLTVEINRYLPDYLRVVYRFFGWWVISIGMLIMALVQVTRMGTALARNLILGILFIILIVLYYMVYNFLPTSPIKIAMHILTGLWFISAISSIKIEKFP
tara:strand:- start:14920 stop:15387 length:468 start_codon:yes stop_codon:yes gene_type:complete